MSINADNQIPDEYRKGRSRVNRTVAALMDRGVDIKLAASLRDEGFTLGKLQQQDEQALVLFGIPQHAVDAILKSARPPIPFGTLASVLIANRFTCCVCHDNAKSVVVHHINPWAKSRDHGASNLAVLCQEHHDKAHQSGGLTQNLTPELVAKAKQGWEAEAAKFDARAILDATAAESDNWWYFNHQRLFTLANDLRVSFLALPHFHSALARGLIDRSGTLVSRDKRDNWMYAGGDGIPLAYYVSDVLRAVLAEIPVFNTSDDLDRGILEGVVKPGDFIFVQGAMTFKAIAKRRVGPGQTTLGRRRANNVAITFSLDRWEATSQSAWSGLLLGHHEACALLRVLGLAKKNGEIQIETTSLAIGPALQGLKAREYSNAPFRPGYVLIDDVDEGEEEIDMYADLSWEDHPDNPANYDAMPESLENK